MGQLTQLVKKYSTIVAILGTVIAVLVLGYFVIYPSFGSISTASSDLAAQKAKVAALDQSISKLRGQDKARLQKLIKFLNTLVPTKIDYLHFAALNEIVAGAAGAEVDNISITKGAVAKKTTPAAPAPATTSKTAAAPAAKTQAPTQVAPPTVSVTYSSDFEGLLRLIRYWLLADQLVGIKSITINSGSGQLSYTLIYDLPTSPAATKATIEDHLTLSETEKKKLEKLQENIIYTATPSANPVGKNNPFN